jgi:hypothetical protein
MDHPPNGSVWDHECCTAASVVFVAECFQLLDYSCCCCCYYCCTMVLQYIQFFFFFFFFFFFE